MKRKKLSPYQEMVIKHVEEIMGRRFYQDGKGLPNQMWDETGNRQFAAFYWRSDVNDDIVFHFYTQAKLSSKYKAFRYAIANGFCIGGRERRQPARGTFQFRDFLEFEVPPEPHKETGELEPFSFVIPTRRGESMGKKKRETEESTEKKPVKKDKWGCKIGSQASRINMCIFKSKYVHTINELSERLGISSARVRSHVKYLQIKGHVKVSRRLETRKFRGGEITRKGPVTVGKEGDKE